MVNLAQYQTQIEEAKEFSGKTMLASGEYIFALIDSEEKENSKKNGHFIQLTWEVQDGEFVGEQFIDRINHDNPNETARNIAFATLKSLARCIDKDSIADTDELLGKRVRAVIENKVSDRPILDEAGEQKLDNDGNPLFYRNVNVRKYQALNAGGATSGAGTGGAVSSPPAQEAKKFPFVK